MSLVCSVTQVLSTLRSSAPRARKPFPQSSALRLCRPPLTLRPFHSALLRCKGGDTPQLAVATPRLRQVAFGMYVTCHCHNNGIHSTGHDTRLNRTFGAHFGDELYSKEELVAEMGAAFLCAIAGIANENTERNTTAYIQNWISKLESDNRLLIP